jgi:cytochrome c oxidase assembly protein subunit 15
MLACGMNVALRWLAGLTGAGMWLVLVMGAAVTNTGSAEGCGRSWPLCNGQFVPEFTVSTAIEYSHRAVTGVESLLVVALTAAMLGLWRHDPQAVVLALLMLGTLLLQAGLGAGAVLWPQSALMLATHFGVSLLAFASTFLSAQVVFERTQPANLASRQQLSSRFRNWAIAVGVYVLGVVYLGAYVRHAGMSLACLDWPLCNGEVVPDLQGAAAVVFAHRLAAVGALLLMAWLAHLAVRYRMAEYAAIAGAGLALLQALSGALLVWTRLGLFSTLAHAAIMALLFGCLAVVVRVALGLDRNDAYARRFSSRRWQSTHSVASGRASRRSGGIARPHSWHTP